MRFVTTLVAAVAATLLLAPPATAAPQDSGSLSDLTGAVLQQVQEKYPNAYLVEVDGSAPNGPTTDVSDVTTWRHVFNDIKDGCVCKIFVTAHLDDGTIDDFQAQPGIWVGSTTLHPPITMRPDEADSLLKQAGYTGEYKFVTLRQPNAGSFEPHPLYIFGKITGIGYVAVDTTTGEVKRIS